MWEGWVPWCGAGPGLGVVAVTSWGTGDEPSMSTPVGCIQGWGSGKGWLCLLPPQGKACSRHTQKPQPSPPILCPCPAGWVCLSWAQTADTGQVRTLGTRGGFSGPRRVSLDAGPCGSARTLLCPQGVMMPRLQRTSQNLFWQQSEPIVILPRALQGTESEHRAQPVWYQET